MTPARLALAALLSACAAAKDRGAPGPEPGPAAVHHDLKVRLAPDRRGLEAEDTVTLSPALREQLGDAVPFTLHAGLAPERVGPGAPLERASGSPGSADVPVESFTVKLARGERSFTIRYGGEVFHAIERRGAESERSMSESAGLVAREGALLSGATRWIPEVADVLLTFTLEARVPAAWDVISQGARTRHAVDGEERVARWESHEPQEEALLVAGPFVERSRPAGPVLVQTFLRADEPELAERYLGTGARYLAMYERLLGPYPYSKFALVENFWETGYGMPSFTLLGSSVVRFPFILHSSYPHEILHNWWGNGVYVDARSGNWCEGLTAYLADHLVKEQRGEGAEYRRTSLQRYADYVAAHQDFPVREFRSRHGYVTQAVGYDKVLMVFHMLRRKVGDDRFVEGLRRFYAEQRFRAASFGDLGRAMSGAAGEDLAPWLAQWIDRAGAPALRLERAEAKPGAVELILAQAQPGPPFDVDVPVDVTVGGQVLRRSVRLATGRQAFTLAVEGDPARVDVDPEYDVLRRLDPSEIPPALSGVFGATETVIVLPSAAPVELRRAYAALADAWRKEGTEVVSDADLARLPAGKAAWILGWENRLREALAEGVRAFGGELSRDGLRTGASALTRRANSVVVAVRNPGDPARVVAFLGADDPSAAPGLARKLPHYGKYGVLGFVGPAPDNVAKEVWQVQRSPLTAILREPGARAVPPPRKALAELPGE